MASPPETPSGARPPGMPMKLVVIGAAVLVVAGGIAFYLASRSARRDAAVTAADAVTVTITGRSCEPNDLVVPAGRATFRIVNASDRPVEWEILDGVMVVEERENIAPGFSQTLSAKLTPGSYTITCGLLSNPRGTLRVTPSASSEVAAGPTPVAVVGALAEYRVFLAMESAALVEATRSFTDALKAGDVERAKDLYASARVPYKRMQPVVERIADLDAAIDARADFWEQREEDPRFTGFHRIESALFGPGRTDGLGEFAEKLQADVTALQQRIRGTKVPPEGLAAGAARALGQIADQKASGDDNRWSHADLSDFKATLEGCRKITDLLRPLIVQTNPALADAIDTRFAVVEATLAHFRRGDRFVGYDQVGPEDRAGIAREMRALADEIMRLDAALGLS